MKTSKQTRADIGHLICTLISVISTTTSKMKILIFSNC